MEDTGVSIGWFDTWGIYPDPGELAGAIRMLLGQQLKRERTWPFVSRPLRWAHQDLPVAYSLIGGCVPLHCDDVGRVPGDGRVFQFVIEVENRPALLFAQTQTPQSEAILRGMSPPTAVQTFYTGGIELKAGMTVHFDVTKTFHGITGMPVAQDAAAPVPPRAVIVQVGGFAREEVGEALSFAAKSIAADVLASSQ